MKKVGIIGLGYWGKILNSKLEKFCDVKFTCISKDTYFDKLESVDWVIISTPNETHYEIVENCLLAGKNVFCEKPLTLTYEESKKLFRLAKYLGVKLYVDDIQNYREYNFNIYKNNLVERRKSDGDLTDVLYMLAYHDFYVLYKYIKDLKIKDIILIDNINTLHFKIQFNDNTLDLKNIEFIYDLNSKEKKHNINGYSLIGEDDIIPKMLSNVINEKVDFEYNKKISLFSNKFIDKLNSKLFKEIIK